MGAEAEPGPEAGYGKALGRDTEDEVWEKHRPWGRTALSSTPWDNAV